MYKSGSKTGSLTVGDIVHLDPRVFPNLKVISKEEADKIANASPSRQFIITEVK